MTTPALREAARAIVLARRDRLTSIDLRWPHLATGTYSELRQRQRWRSAST